jgi:hypothetical protein
MVSIGADLNLWFLDIPYVKSVVYLNGAFRFGRTQLSWNYSTQVAAFGIRGFNNTFQVLPEIGYKLNGYERYSLDFTYSPIWIVSDERGFVQTDDTFGLVEDKQTFKVSKQNKLH